jgi:translation initiation factor IF-2
MSAKTKQPTKNLVLRPPVIAVMGHIDHGKSKLLDYIRKTNVVDAEAGGITQRISAYEVRHTTKEGETKNITFLDTPGHEAFRAVRARGAQVADIAVLVVAADEGVKPQTLEALETIRGANIPFIVALNKIDKQGVTIERAKASLSEHGIYAEDYGGDIPVVPVSAVTGEGIPDLLDMILLVADIAELKGDPSDTPSGVVIEASVDKRKGISATLIIKAGTIRQGEYIVAGDACAPVRIMEDFMGKKLAAASFSMPVHIVGFNKLPEVGAIFESAKNKKEAEALALKNKGLRECVGKTGVDECREVVFPVVIRTDVFGSLAAIKHELAKIQNDFVGLKVVGEGMGNINETDVKLVAGSEHSTILGFNTGTDAGVRELAERMSVEIKTFDIIYKLSEWVGEKMSAITPEKEIEEKHGEAKILRCFSKTKARQVIGGRVLSGTLSKGDTVIVMRRGTEIGRGKILELQSQKSNVQSVYEETEFGAMVEMKIEILGGDTLVAFKKVKK